jgi:TatD DNase family protein
MWIDTHAHLNDESFDGKIEVVLARAAAAGVDRILVIGIDVPSSARAVELAQQHEPLYAVVGIQPNSLGDLTTSARSSVGDWAEIERLSTAAKVVAVGETGLDRYWNRVELEIQREYFDRHLTLAAERDLPVVIHCRQAEAEVVSAVADFVRRTVRPIRGVMHSYTGDLETARACVELGLHISFAGMVTFKNNVALRTVAGVISLERLLVETDSPYLAPEPMRGRPNEPAHLIHTGACLAGVRGMTPASLAAATSANAISLFRLPRWNG